MHGVVNLTADALFVFRPDDPNLPQYSIYQNMPKAVERIFDKSLRSYAVGDFEVCPALPEYQPKEEDYVAGPQGLLNACIEGARNLIAVDGSDQERLCSLVRCPDYRDHHE